MKYRLYVYCRSNGINRVSGLHTEMEYNSDAEAKDELKAEGSVFYNYYDTVSMTFVRVEADGKETKI